MEQTTHTHHHDKAHDPGHLYKEQWVQTLILQIQAFVREHHLWLGLTPSVPQRILDYACGDGTISSALAPICPDSSFQGLDLLPSQVSRFSDAARTLLGDSEAAARRMFAIQGDLLDPSDPELASPRWRDFDVAVISMALHHVGDPVGMLRALVGRVRRGGVVVVIDWLAGEEEGKVRVGGDDGMEIWGGFTEGGIGGMMGGVGLRGVEVRVDPRVMEVPVGMGGREGGMRGFYARGIVG